MRTVTLLFTSALLAAGLLFTGCSSGPRADEKSASKEPVKTYAMKGEITGLDASQHVATIKHEKIEGFMEAMTMGYPVKDPAEFSRLAVGNAITATVYSGGDDMYIGNIQKAAAGAPADKSAEKK